METTPPSANREDVEGSPVPPENEQAATTAERIRNQNAEPHHTSPVSVSESCFREPETNGTLPNGLSGDRASEGVWHWTFSVTTHGMDRLPHLSDWPSLTSFLSQRSRIRMLNDNDTGTSEMEYGAVKTSHAFPTRSSVTTLS